VNPSDKSTWILAIILTLQTIIPEPSEAQDRTQARSMVISRGGIAASEHPLASQAGATILAQGGNAIDAAIAANAMMGVVAPMMCGIGGDLFAIVYEAKSGKMYGLNASGWAPQGLNVGFLRSKGFETMPSKGIHSVTVPGAVDGWVKLNRRFGRKKLAAALAPAIHFAEKGFPVTELDAEYWAGGESLLRKDENAMHTYLTNGRSPRLGEIYRNQDLAKSYRRIAAKGRNGFYKGETARRLVEYSKRQGGTMNLEDLAQYSCEWVKPISTTYQGWTVYEIPPNGQGIAALTMLNVMENFPLAEKGHNSVAALHVMIEAKKLAYADMLRYVADPKFSKIPVAGILSKDYARQRAQLINLEKANCHAEAGTPPAAGNDTTYLCVVDRDGNMVSLIQSNYGSFGSGLVPDQCGFVLQNRGGLFTLDANHPNHLAGRKRPLHTIIPALMAKGDVRIAFGIMGGWNQSQAHAQFVSNVADHKLNIQAALEAPRFSKGSFDGCDVAVETRIPATVIGGLESRGHQVQVKGSFSQTVGGGQAVMRDFAAGVNYGASDPRKDGAAIPEPLLKN
jgi:gamma-glutamyltranspeptidase/glutathione hydrolase